MTIDEIIKTHEALNRELKIALATMERSNKIYDIKKRIIENQKQCPHFDHNYNWTIANDTCPYCGFHFPTGGTV